MGKFLLSIGIILIGLAAGQLLRKQVKENRIKDTIPVGKYIRIVQVTALLGINPFIAMGAFWVAKLDDAKYIALPVLGISALALGGILGFGASKLLKHDRRQAGSMFVSGSFTNIGNFGGLICFAFFGESSYAFVSMYKLFEDVSYFLVGYPIAKLHGRVVEDVRKQNPLVRILTDPFIMTYLVSILLGVALNASGMARPGFYRDANEVLIPLSSFLLVVSVGYNMRFNAVGGYLKECFSIAIIKFAVIPAVIASSAYFLGIGTLQDGLILKVITVLSAMPPAFNSLIPPQIYDLDADLANSCWLFCTGSLIAVVPMLYLLTRLM